MGTMTFGGQTPEKDAVDIVRYAIENGVNFIDTTDIYPDADGRTGGSSEIAVGKGIAECDRFRGFLKKHSGEMSRTNLNNF